MIDEPATIKNVNAEEFLDWGKSVAEDIAVIMKHVESILKQLEIINKELAVHDLQAQNDMGVIKTDIGFLKNNIEKTQVCLTDVNEVLDKLTTISHSNTRSIGAAAESIKDLATVLSANADKREEFYQREISKQHEVEAAADEAERKLQRDVVKARDRRIMKLIAVAGGVVTAACTVIILIAERLYG